jgi:hypothetical protein
MFHCKGKISCQFFPMKCKLLPTRAAFIIFVLYWLKYDRRLCNSNWEVLFLCNYGRLFLFPFLHSLGIIMCSFQSYGISFYSQILIILYPLHSYWFCCFYHIYFHVIISWGFAILHFCNGNFNIQAIRLDYVTASIPLAMFLVQNNLW